MRLNALNLCLSRAVLWPAPAPAPIAMLTYLPIGLSAPLALALGTRKMVSGYSGPALMAQRLSDSATLDIGFAGQVLDRSAALTHQASSTLGVSRMYDQSGNGLHATETAAANQLHLFLGAGDSDVAMITGRRTGVNIATLAAPRRLRLQPMPSVNRNNVTIFKMVRDVATYRKLNDLEFGDLTNNADLSLESRGNYGSLTARWDDAGTLRELAANDSTYKTVPAASLSISVFRSTGSAATVWRDSYSALPVPNQAITSRTLANGGQWGYIHTFNSAAAVGEHHALLVYNGILTDAEVAQVVTALQAIYGSRALTQTQAVFMVGDSIGEGLQALDNRTLARQLEPLFSNTVVWRNYGQSGKQAFDLQNTAVPGGMAFIPGTTGRWQVAGGLNVAHIHVGVNDITAGTDANTIYGYINNLVGQALGVGFSSVVVDTILPTTYWTSTYTANEAVRQSLNSLIRGKTASNPYTVADVAAHPIMGTTTAPNDPTLYPDKLHPSELGYSYLASTIQAALSSVGIS